MKENNKIPKAWMNDSEYRALCKRHGNIWFITNDVFKNHDVIMYGANQGYRTLPTVMEMDEPYEFKQILKSDGIENEYWLSSGFMINHCQPDYSSADGPIWNYEDLCKYMTPQYVSDEVSVKYNADVIDPMITIMIDNTSFVVEAILPTDEKRVRSISSCESLNIPRIVRHSINNSIVVCKQLYPKEDQIHFEITYQYALMLFCEFARFPVKILPNPRPFDLDRPLDLLDFAQIIKTKENEENE